MPEEKFEEMSLIGHLTELRKRLLWSFIYILIIFVICFYFADELFSFLAYPLVSLLDTENGQGFIYTALQEAFFYRIKNCFFLCFIFCLSFDSYTNLEVYSSRIIQKREKSFSSILNCYTITFLCGRFNGILYNFTNRMVFFSILPKYGFIWSTNKIRSENGRISIFNDEIYFCIRFSLSITSSFIPNGESWNGNT